ncbi:phosphatidylserine/phosphatidylglycerophosphate/cardiolipin synthase family protein [bacterium]|nr:phosphatidylserine/phosphatidylglycerophosphate/cardiolipin synthase family protein [bacterium]
MKPRAKVFVSCLILVCFYSTIAWGFKPPQDNPALSAAFQALQTNSPDTSTKVRYLWQNAESWYSRWKIVNSAKKTIDCTYFIIDKDIFGQAFLGLLVKKAREGVQIRLMCDWRIAHSSYMTGVIDKMQELAAFPNVQIKLYNSAVKQLAHVFTDFRKLVASNHDKILIGDGNTCIIGGKNIGADYFVGKGENKIVYRDTDILMQGAPVAAQLKQAFDLEWAYLKNTVIKPDRFNFKDQSASLDLAYQVMNRYMMGMGLFDPEKGNLDKGRKKLLIEFNEEISKFKGITSYSSFDQWHGERPKPVKIIDKTARTGPLNGITPALISFIDAAKEEILIQNPYVVLTKVAEEALKRASQRGVKIIIHSNSGGSTDSLFPQAFLMTDWVRLMAEMPTLRLVMAPSENERLHSKTFCFDGQLVIIGSYNMDPLSEQVISEVVAAVFDKQFGTMVQKRIYNDMKPCLDYKIKIEPNGKVTPVFGPDSHLDPEIIKKMNFYRKIEWIRPII